MENEEKKECETPQKNVSQPSETKCETCETNNKRLAELEEELAKQYASNEKTLHSLIDIAMERDGLIRETYRLHHEYHKERGEKLFWLCIATFCVLVLAYLVWRKRFRQLNLD